MLQVWSCFILKKYSMKIISHFHILYLFGILFLLQSCADSTEPTNSEKINIFCDIERIDSSNKMLIGDQNGRDISLKMGGFYSNEKSKSGQYSVKLNAEKPYGLNYQFHKLDEGKRFKASVWRYDPSAKSALVIAGDKTHVLYQAEKTAKDKTDDGWELLEVEFEVKPNLDYIKIYCWIVDADYAYFDDLKIEELPPQEFPKYVDQAKLHLYFDDVSWNVFEQSRQRAYRNGILEQSDDDWANGIVSNGVDVLPIKARLKGDWLDHLDGVKWSYRIKMRKSTSLNGYSVFSLQNPLTRSNLMEYVAHQLFKDNDILTTRYGFIPLYVNGESRGVYAIEEHFAKQLIESNNRREGPILRFSEEAFWAVQKYFKLNKKWPLLPYYQAAIAEGFQSGKIISTPSLKAQFSIAQSLLYQYKTHQKPISQIFDIDKLAKYWAVVDLTKARHGMAWHNQRFYYNPVLCLLEPIAFDAYTGGMEQYSEDKAIYGNLWFPKNHQVAPNENLLLRIFQNTDFQHKYLAYLEEISQEEYIATFFDKHNAAISTYETLLAEEFKAYKYDSSFIVNSAKAIRDELPRYKERIANLDIQSYALEEKIMEFDTMYQADILPHFVNAFYYTSENKEQILEVENYYNLPINLIGLTTRSGSIQYRFKNDEYKLKPYNNEVQSIRIATEADTLVNRLIFQVQGKSDLLYTNLNFWEKEKGESPRQELLRTSKYLETGLFQVKGDTLFVLAGEYTLDKLIVIPADKLLYFESGVALDMINSGGILSFSPVEMRGSSIRPIRIFSSDSSAMGFSVIQSHAENVLENVVFSHLNNFSFKGWELSGAVNFYEADVKLKSVRFENNYCEDALNIIRSKCDLDLIEFDATFGDAFDGDFVQGTVKNAVFSNIGNDAFDFSGSQLELTNCEIQSAGDKGISAGENSQLILKDIVISNVNIGIAAKDFSEVTGQGIHLNNCVYALLAFQKKPEYGPAKLTLTNVNFKEVYQKYLIEEHSNMHLNNRFVNGTQKSLAKRFYDE